MVPSVRNINRVFIGKITSFVVGQSGSTSSMGNSESWCIRFSVDADVINISNIPESDRPIAKPLYQPTRELSVGDQVYIIKSNTLQNDSFFYLPTIDDSDQSCTINYRGNLIDLTSTNKITIKSKDSTITIDGESGDISVLSPKTLNITSEVVNVNSNSSVEVTSPVVNIKGNLSVSGDITSANGSISLSNHMHIGNLGANTSPPIPG